MNKPRPSTPGHLLSQYSTERKCTSGLNLYRPLVAAVKLAACTFTDYEKIQIFTQHFWPRHYEV